MKQEEEILIGLKMMNDGNPEGFSMVYANAYDRVFAGAMALMQEADEAEDLTQEVFLLLYEDAAKLENVATFDAWIGEKLKEKAFELVKDRKEVLVEEEHYSILDDATEKGQDIVLKSDEE